MALFYYKTKMKIWVKGEQKEKIVAKQHLQGVLTEKDIAKRLTKSLSMEAPEILLMMDELADQIMAAVLSGRSVKVDGLGTFSPSQKTHGNENVDDVNANAIEKVKINFRPDNELKRAMQKAKVEYYEELNTQHINK